MPTSRKGSSFCNKVAEEQDERQRIHERKATRSRLEEAHTEESPCEDIKTRQPPTSQGEKLQKKPILAIPQTWISSLPKL